MNDRSNHSTKGFQLQDTALEFAAKLTGPAAADQLLARDGREWRTLD